MPLSAAEAAEVAAVNTDGKPEGERERLVWAMERCGWVQAKAARLLKISPRQMGYALQKNGIEVRKF
jgi:Nif-specific regulatory protein